jgi:uncharacterized protein (DUF4415 family)
MKKTTTKPLTAQQRADLDAVAAMPDDTINTAEMAEQVDWSSAKRGMFFRPIKKQITLRIDADLIEWFRQHTTPGSGYQTRINEALRDYVARTGKR